MKKDNIIIANWKTLVPTVAAAKKLLTAYSKLPSRARSRIVICPPFPLLPMVVAAKLRTGSQTVSGAPSGSTTGRVSAELLASLKVKYAIVGHSEERANGTTSKMVQEQILQALEWGITPIVCVGEKNRSGSNPFAELEEMVMQTFSGLNKSHVENCILAYEPLWAIGAGATRPATSHEAQEAILFCKKLLVMKLLPGKNVTIRSVYGGSVDESNAAEFLQTHDIDGLLVGRASTNPAQFAQLVSLL